MSRGRWLLRAGACTIVALVAAVLTLFIAAQKKGGNAPAVAATSLSEPATMALSNRDPDPGSPAGDIPAPEFVLRDQQDQSTSLAQFRGKVVVLTFIDPECTQICPLTTQSMAEALKILGPDAASQVQLLGIDANPSEDSGRGRGCLHALAWVGGTMAVSNRLACATGERLA